MPTKKVKPEGPGDLADDAIDWITKASDFVDFLGGGDPENYDIPDEDEEDGTEETEPVGTRDPPRAEPKAKAPKAKPRTVNVTAIILVAAGSEEKWRNQVDRILGPLLGRSGSQDGELSGIRNSLVTLIREACEENGNRIFEDLT